MTNMEFWEKLRMVPKDAQKPFSRANGFKGTAINPMWTIKTMTEVFGACGTGWGIGKPEFTTIPADDELLVYCTVTVWYMPPIASGAQLPPSHLVGVGGDKVLTKHSNGTLSTDDEAFKKAFTDAVTNALKTLGAGADIYMGAYDANKYVEDLGNCGQSHPEQYMKWALNRIQGFESKDQLLTWWTGEKRARVDHQLAQEHVDRLRTAMLERFPPEQRSGRTCGALSVEQCSQEAAGTTKRPAAERTTINLPSCGETR